MKKIIRDKFLLTEVWFKLILFVFFIFLFSLSSSYPDKSKEFPQLIIILSLIMIAISLAIDFTRKETVDRVVSDVDDSESKVLDDATKKVKRKRFYRAWAVILISTAIGFLGGFLLSSFSLFIGFGLSFGKRTGKALFKNILIAIILTMLIYAVFQWIMGVPLLTGVLWDFSY